MRTLSIILTVAALSAILLSARLGLGAEDPGVLWHIVHDQCVAGQQSQGNPAPCEYADVAGGYVVLKDRDGPTQYLVMPTQRVTGIESPDLLLSDTPNYWHDAWNARAYVFARAGREIPRYYMGMAVNSAKGRSQNQLHIHIDCLSKETAGALQVAAEQLDKDGASMSLTLSGHPYRAMRIDSSDLHGVYPFRLLAASDEAIRTDMADETLALAGAVFKNNREGFIMLSDKADLLRGDLAHSEELLDQQCEVLKDMKQ